MIRTAYVILTFLILPFVAIAQLSPGPLASAHQHLEGLTNCTKCHDLGKKVTNEKCLQCHLEIKKRVEKKLGYHSSKEVQTQACIKCHSDHHGQKFEIVHFDKSKFDHLLTGYKLTGKHIETDCASCHKPTNIADLELKKKKYTYLGLDVKCINCHEDVHDGTLKSDCGSCHTTASFVPAKNFDHQQSKFPIVGKHKEVSCEKCHKIENKGGEKFQRFTGIPFAQCSDCHKNVHSSKFGQHCAACHNENSFESLNSKISFNHSNTDFVLKGRHKTVDCKSCHQASWNILTSAFKDFPSVKTTQCNSCHKDIHANKFGGDCTKCHTEQSFRSKIVPTNFNHDLTAFKLLGKHIDLDCKKCHKHKLTDDLLYEKCFQCHEDYHHGQFTSSNTIRDCNVCHTSDNFTETTYSIEDHSNTNFPLNGGHLATPCKDCHLKEKKWTFKFEKISCIGCHNDVHSGRLDPKYYPDKQCTACHSSSTWQEINFQHTATKYPLTGKHTTTNCNACHRSNPDAQRDSQVIFKLNKSKCVECHFDNHQQQFALNNFTDCSRCHHTEDWDIKLFDHSKADFKLDGAHKNVSCDQCHKPFQINNVTCIQYKFISYKCIDCHF